MGGTEWPGKGGANGAWRTIRKGEPLWRVLQARAQRLPVDRRPPDHPPDRGGAHRGVRGGRP